MLFLARPLRTSIPVALALALSAAQAGAQRGEWTMPGKDYASTRYSDLAQINAANVQQLRMVWNFSKIS